MRLLLTPFSTRFKTVTLKDDPALLKAIIKIFTEEASTVLDIPGLLPFFAFQPLSTNIISKMSKNGGNALGLSVADGPLTSRSHSIHRPAILC